MVFSCLNQFFLAKLGIRQMGGAKVDGLPHSLALFEGIYQLELYALGAVLVLKLPPSPSVKVVNTLL